MSRLKLVYDRFNDNYIVYRLIKFLWIKTWKKEYESMNKDRAERYFNRYITLGDKNSEDENHIPSKT